LTTSFELTYGAVLLAVFAQQLCFPVPSVVFLMAAGALSARGQMHAGLIVLIGVLGCLAGDGIWFWFGRKWGSKAMWLLCRLSADPRHCSRNAREKFRRYGLPLFCVAKFLPGLDLVVPPLGGAEGVSVPTFLALDAIGGLLWSGSYVGLGYVFSHELNAAIRWVQHFGAVLGIAIGVPAGLYAGWRILTLVRMIRQLRLRRISPALLARKLRSNNRVAVLDLVNFEEESDAGSIETIPGAFIVDPSLLRRSPRLTVPDGVDVVLCSSSGGDTVSARAAVGLKRIGIEKVWVLEGGLKAWRERGLPVSRCPEAREVVAERVGIKLRPPKTPSGGDSDNWANVQRNGRGALFGPRRRRLGWISRGTKLFSSI
jgi:membrane protein DedA with SNARE-associated domain/rhodanese-related sulfurtransferase